MVRTHEADSNTSMPTQGHSIVPSLDTDRHLRGASPFTVPAAALAHTLNRDNHLFVLQLAECPAVHMIFREFARDCMAHHPEISESNAYIAVDIFHDSLESNSNNNNDDNDNDNGTRLRPWKHTTPAMRDRPRERGVEAHIANFMLRCHDWVELHHAVLREQFRADAGLRVSVLFGVLGVCVRAHRRGQFPDGPADHDASVDAALGAWVLQFSGGLVARACADLLAASDGARRGGARGEAAWFVGFLGLLPRTCAADACVGLLVFPAAVRTVAY